MKSFRVYLREPTNEPRRFVSDLSADEREAFEQRFAPIASRYRRHMRTALALFGGGGVVLVAGTLLSRTLAPVLSPIAICFWIAGIAILLLSPRLVCPNCVNKLTHCIGPYCPTCGKESVVPGSWLRPPSCSGCRRSLGRSRGNRYRICFCTHCGLMLDRAGLWQ